MSRTRSRDTGPEMAIRRLLHAAGYRYRVNLRVERSLRRTVDVAFTSSRVAVFVDGCFWHRCPLHYVEPKTRSEFWRAKISRNVERDQETTAALNDAGWTVLRFWEHASPEDAVATIIATINDSAARARDDGPAR